MTANVLSKKSRQLSDFLRERFTDYAKEDVAQNVYMKDKREYS